MYLTLGIVRALPCTCTVAFEKLTASESNPISLSEEAQVQPEKMRSMTVFLTIKFLNKEIPETFVLGWGGEPFLCIIVLTTYLEILFVICNVFDIFWKVLRDQRSLSMLFCVQNFLNVYIIFVTIHVINNWIQTTK